MITVVLPHLQSSFAWLSREAGLVWRGCVSSCTLPCLPLVLMVMKTKLVVCICPDFLFFHFVKHHFICPLCGLLRLPWLSLEPQTQQPASVPWDKAYQAHLIGNPSHRKVLLTLLLSYLRVKSCPLVVDNSCAASAAAFFSYWSLWPSTCIQDIW